MDAPDTFFHWQDATLILRLKVQPRSSRNAWGEVLGDRIKLYLTTPPVDGKANAAVVAFVAQTFGVAKSQVHLHRGQMGRDKEIHIHAPKIIQPMRALLGLL